MDREYCKKTNDYECSSTGIISGTNNTRKSSGSSGVKINHGMLYFHRSIQVDTLENHAS